MGTRPLVVALTHRYDIRHTLLSFANPFERACLLLLSLAIPASLQSLSALLTSVLPLSS